LESNKDKTPKIGTKIPKNTKKYQKIEKRKHDNKDCKCCMLVITPERTQSDKLSKQQTTRIRDDGISEKCGRSK
jgi:hypothetical protein